MRNVPPDTQTMSLGGGPPGRSPLDRPMPPTSHDRALPALPPMRWPCVGAARRGHLPGVRRRHLLPSKMLPGSSCCMAEFLPSNRLLVGRERAADLRQHLRRRDRACPPLGVGDQIFKALTDRKSTRLNSSHVRISYAVFCLKKKK